VVAIVKSKPIGLAHDGSSVESAEVAEVDFPDAQPEGQVQEGLVVSPREHEDPLRALPDAQLEALDDERLTLSPRGHEDPLSEEPMAMSPSMYSRQHIASVMSLESRDILRATNLRSILHNGGQILQDSAGSEETYRQSRSANWIDIFISHNWAVPRRKKFWALALHFNVCHAMVTAYVGAGLGFLLNQLSTPPAFKAVDFVYRPYCLIMGSCGFFLALTVGHDLPWVGSLLCRERIFLDKVCINQTDPILKAIGIRHIGAFLSHSGKMLVLFNSLYCKNLWTVYEVACFIYLHRRDKLVLLPVDIAQVVLQSTALIMFVHVVAVLAVHYGGLLGIGGDAVRVAATCSVGGSFIAALAFILRRWALQQSELFSDLRSFELSKARCSDESDREVISGNICHFMRAMGLVHDDASEAGALLTFDKLVQESVPELLRSAIGRTGFPYKYALVAGTAHDFYTFDIISSQQEVSALFVLAWLLFSLNMRAVVLPSVFLVCAWVGRTFAPQRRWAELAIKCGTAALATLVLLGLYMLSDFFRDRAMDSVRWLLSYLLLCAVQVLGMAGLFSWKPNVGPMALHVQQVQEALDSPL